jgi:hypothetical protein
MVAQAQSSGSIDPDLDPALVSFMIRGLMNDLGPFLQSRFGDRNGDWVELSEVAEVFDRVIEVLKNGLGVKSAG